MNFSQHIDGLLRGSTLKKNEIPNFERNKVNFDQLSKIESWNKSSDQLTQEEVQIMEILQQEFIAEESRLERILKLLELDSVASDKMVQVIANVNCEIGKNCITGALSASPPIMHHDNSALTQSLQYLQSLEKVQQSLNQMQMNDITENVSKVKETEFLSKKTSEYASHIRHLEKKLENLGYDSELGVKHGDLSSNARQLSATKSSLTQLRSKLSVYTDINCDIKMARLQVQNLKEELVLLEKEIADNISNINSS